MFSLALGPLQAKRMNSMFLSSWSSRDVVAMFLGHDPQTAVDSKARTEKQVPLGFHSIGLSAAQSQSQSQRSNAVGAIEWQSPVISIIQGPDSSCVEYLVLGRGRGNQGLLWFTSGRGRPGC